MKDHVAAGFGIICIIYLIASGVLVMSGIMDSKYTYTDCKYPKRYEYIFPAYRLGCWLGEPK